MRSAKMPDQHCFGTPRPRRYDKFESRSLQRRVVRTSVQACLDGIEDCLAALLAYRVAEDAPEQPNIFAQRNVFVVLRFNFLRVRHGPTFGFIPQTVT